MRVTNNMLTNRMISYLNTNLERMSGMEAQLSSGKKISLPSDDPMIASRAMKFRTDLSEVSQYSRNVDDALSWAEVTDSTLSGIGEIVQKAKELSIQAGTGTNSISEREQIKEEAQQLYNQLVTLANKTYAGRYIFSGFKTDQQLILQNDQTFNYTDTFVVTDGTNFRLRHDNISTMTDIKGEIGGVPTTFNIVATPPAVSGDVYVDTASGMLTFYSGDVVSNITASYTINRTAGAYNPDAYSYSSMTQSVPMENEDIKFEIGIGDKIDINVIGTDLFGPVSGVSGIGDNITNFQNFLNALQANDIPGINQATTDMGAFFTDVLEQRANIGAKTNRLDLTKNRLSDENTNFTDLMSKNEDADIAEVIMYLKNEENVYKASLEIGARVIQPSLLDFLR